MNNDEVVNLSKAEARKMLNDFWFDDILPRIIEQFLNQNETIISKDDAHILDKLLKEDVLNKVASSTHITFSIHREFLETAKDAIEKERYYVAAVLSSTCIEHILNMFYAFFFKRKFGLDKSSVDNAMKSLNIRDKCTWLLLLVADEVIEEGLLNDILRLNTLRNSIIHFKAHGIPVDNLDEDTRLDKDIKKYKSTIVSSPETILRLDNICNQIMNRVSPNIERAYNIAQTLKESKQNNE